MKFKLFFLVNQCRIRKDRRFLGGSDDFCHVLHFIRCPGQTGQLNDGLFLPTALCRHRNAFFTFYGRLAFGLLFLGGLGYGLICGISFCYHSGPRCKDDESIPSLRAAISADRALLAYGIKSGLLKQSPGNIDRPRSYANSAATPTSWRTKNEPRLAVPSCHGSEGPLNTHSK